ncbi:MAG: hypothetical protein BWX70_03219 [Verrucomicrobia bacterium ADurb.Bin070]|nr:MAG: hypothetical protein BWX70_03219 [Verrucomicrobia bacterium ADurb.Bin070]
MRALDQPQDGPHFHVVLDPGQPRPLLDRRGERLSLAGLPHRLPDREDIAEGGVCAVEEETLRAHIGIVEEQFAPGACAVAARATDLLIVRFQAAGNVPVHHETEIPAVNAHAESVGRHHQRRGLGHEPVLRGSAFAVRHRPVVGDRREAVAFKPRGHAFDHLARRTINDPATIGLGRLHESGEFVPVRRAARHGQVKVRPREAGDRDRRRLARRFAQPQLPYDILAHVGCGGGGHGQHPYGAELGQHLFQIEVVRPEIMAPLTDAVRLVDREERYLGLRQYFSEPPVAKTLRRHVDELVPARAHAVEPVRHLGAVHR